MRRLLLLLALLSTAAFARTIKDPTNAVSIYSGANSTPVINAATTGAVTIGPSGSSQTHTVNGSVSVTGVVDASAGGAKVPTSGSCLSGTVCSGVTAAGSVTVTCLSSNCPQGNVANVTQQIWTRVGSTVTVSGGFQARCDTATGTWQIKISLPISSNITSSDDVSGFAGPYTSVDTGAFAGGGGIVGYVTSHTALAQFSCNQINDSETFRYIFNYTLK